MSLRKIHILDTGGEHRDGTDTKVNCGATVERAVAIRVDWEDGRVCEECREISKTIKNRRKCYALWPGELVKQAERSLQAAEM